MSRLRALGLLEGRKRKGLIVRHPDPLRLLSNSLPSLVGSQEDWRELAMLRYALEVGAIELCDSGPRPTNSSRGCRRSPTTWRRPCGTTRSRSGPWRLDLEFHALILQMTGSRMIAGMQQLLVQFFQIAPHAENTPASAERIIWEHREL